MAQETLSQKSRFSRQTIRRAILIVSFLLLPATLFYISPIVILMGAAQGIATGSLLLFTALFVLSLGVSRVWCGWLCPMGAWQEICSPVMKRRVDGRRDRVKYGVTVLWLSLLAYLFIGAGGILAVDPFYGTVNGFSITSLDTLMMVGFIFFMIFAVAFVMGRRGYCRVVCPTAVLMIVGRKIRNAVGWPALRLAADAGRCIDCGKCSKACPMGLDVHGMVREGRMESAECILCASCADTCPEGVITYGAGGR
ncbi:4Fe-4S binding protein [Methanoculleus sediminis]|uniref:4Fe-4S binding protein n=1 Tax=Methanoculleus sediminis TaxID=1550566 RepID=UPI00064F6B36|nr:4Fe-4S dicluster domain-containing protein [Methanoculleus sediminis]